jgi:uncharacterized protein involved in exopolysaccharide biosynthesis
MDDEVFAIEKRVPFRTYTPKDILSIPFRRRRLLILCAVATVAATLYCAWQLPRYKAEAKLLVMRQRADPVVSPVSQDKTLAVTAPPVVTDEELRSEIELLTSYDLAREVVSQIHGSLGGGSSPVAFLTAWKKWFSTPEELEAGKINSLIGNLSVDVAKGSNIIVVQFKSRDPRMAKQVLDKVIEVYLQRHKAVHRPAGQFDFYQQQTTQYQNNLQKAEAALTEFSGKYGVVNPTADRDIVLQKLNDFKFALHQTQVSVSDAQNRVRSLQAQLTSSPDRITTQLKRADNPELLQQLKSTLLTLQLKRSEMLSKFQPDYPPVQELEAQIAHTKSSIEAQEAQPVKETTTDVDPTHTWIVGEMAKAKSELAGLQASEGALLSTIKTYEASAKDLDQKAIIQHDLQRQASAEEGNYLMYLHKREEARVSDVLDADRLFNVVVAEPPTVPAIPSPSASTYAIVAVFGMTLLSCVLFWALEYFNNTLTTSSEIESYLNIPVLAAVPAQFGGGSYRRARVLPRHGRHSLDLHSDRSAHYQSPEGPNE